MSNFEVKKSKIKVAGSGSCRPLMPNLLVKIAADEDSESQGDDNDGLLMRLRSILYNWPVIVCQ